MDRTLSNRLSAFDHVNRRFPRAAPSTLTLVPLALLTLALQLLIDGLRFMKRGTVDDFTSEAFNLASDMITLR
jgi:hypothetical protein